jgi:hypothetical protein
MRCPNCDIEMGIEHAFEVGPGGKTQRAECPKCFCVCTLVQITVVANVDPGYGEGASVLAKKLAKQLPSIQIGIASQISDNSGKGK